MYNPEKILFKGKIIDITVPISPSTPIFPGDPEPSIEKTCALDKNGCSVSKLIFGSHTGTHVDAPSHVLKDGLPVDRLDINTLMGKAVVLDFSRRRGALTDFILNSAYHNLSDNYPGNSSLKGSDTKNSQINSDLEIPEDVSILLLKTKVSPRKEKNLEILDPQKEDFQKEKTDRGREVEEPVHLDADAACWISQHGFKTVGIDGLSVDGLSSESLPAHHILLSNNVNIVECLDLRSVEEGIYFFLCMPLKIEGCDGAPARALLISCP